MGPATTPTKSPYLEQAPRTPHQYSAFGDYILEGGRGITERVDEAARSRLTSPFTTPPASIMKGQPPTPSAPMAPGRGMEPRVLF